MSRHSHRIDENTVLDYGFDKRPIPGYFYSIERTEDGDREVVEAGDTRPFMVTHPNEEQMNRSEILEVLVKHGVPKKHTEAVGRDMPF